MSLVYDVIAGLGTVRFHDFERTVGEGYPFSTAPAVFTSEVFDVGRSGIDWGEITWAKTVPTGCDVKFQVASRDTDPDAPWLDSEFKGNVGTSTSFYEDASGEELHSGVTGRYLRYRAFLSSKGSATPKFTELRLTFDGDNAWYDRRYGYDLRGNMTEKEVTASTGTTTETRTVNSLNQITQNATAAPGVTTTWTYSWDLNGNLATKSDGTESWSYTFDDDNRLTRVVKTVSSVVTLDVAHTYDSLGRMLTRKLSTDTNPTVFEWDGWDLVREVAPDGVETVYFAPEGEITSFKRGSSVYQVHADALGNVRSVTDGLGATSAQFDYDAWGNTVSSSGTTAASVPQRFIGALGARADSDSGLIFMRYRWLDPAIGCFISRDPIRSANRYRYSANNPTTLIDPFGLQEGFPYGGYTWNEWGLPVEMFPDSPGREGIIPRYYDPTEWDWQAHNIFSSAFNKCLDNDGPGASDAFWQPRQQSIVISPEVRVSPRLSQFGLAPTLALNVDTFGFVPIGWPGLGASTGIYTSIGGRVPPGGPPIFSGTINISGHAAPNADYGGWFYGASVPLPRNQLGANTAGVFAGGGWYGGSLGYTNRPGVGADAMFYAPLYTKAGGWQDPFKYMRDANPSRCDCK